MYRQQKISNFCFFLTFLTLFNVGLIKMSQAQSQTLQATMIATPQDNCSDTRVASSFECQQKRTWTQTMEQSPPQLARDIRPPGTQTGSAARTSGLATTADECMTLPCLCTYMAGQMQPGTNNCKTPNGTFVLEPAVRKEYRTLSDTERSRFHYCLKKIIENGEYARLAQFHSSVQNMLGAHQGCSFAPWHREFMKRCEFSLRKIDPLCALHYWDTTMENGHQNQADSVMYTQELMGSGNNPVNVQSTEWGNGVTWTVVRSPNPNTPYSYTQVRTWQNRKNIPDFLSVFSCNSLMSSALEGGHNGIHTMVCGDMCALQTAPRDPCFYLHHSFVDGLWEFWRIARQTRTERESVYPCNQSVTNCPNARPYNWNETMTPFNSFTIGDGLKNNYTDNLYSYAPRPTCSRTNTNCGSRFLFCDIRTNVQYVRCMVKLRAGGNCTGFESLNSSPGGSACYRGNCVSGNCTSLAGDLPPAQSPSGESAPPPALSIVEVEDCFNQDECCQKWADVNECRNNPTFMKISCRPACGLCHQNESISSSGGCSDKHPQCQQFYQQGACDTYDRWMTENCRKTCNQCGKPLNCPMVTSSTTSKPNSTPSSVYGQSTSTASTSTSAESSTEDVCRPYQ